MKKRNNNDKLDTELGKLTSVEKAVICGSVLGDALVQLRPGSKSRIRILQSDAQADYVLWKFKKLKRLCSTTQGVKKIVNNKKYVAFEFWTSSLSVLTEIHSLFYKEEEYTTKEGSTKKRYVKTITQELVDSLPLDPLVLAVFFLDDGSVRNDCYAGKIATQGFSKDEQELLALYFEKWGININIVCHTIASNQYYMGIPRESFGDFIEIIQPIVKEIPSLYYKLNEVRRPRND